MLRKTVKTILPLALVLLALLAGCGKTGGDGTPTPPAPWQPETLPAVAGEERTPPETPAGETDGLEGSYYNDFLRETMILDGFGGLSVCWPGGVMGGFYRTEDGMLTLLLSDLRLLAQLDADGGLSVAGKQGRYLRDWDFWGITPTEAGIHPVNTLPDVEEVALGGGAYRYRDFGCGLALTYNEALRVAAEKLPNAVTVTDGRSGFVVGRNVTQRDPAGGNAEDFLDAYIRDTVFSDAGTLYAPVDGYENLRMISGAKEGRLAAGEATLDCGGQAIAVRVLLYTSAFADGTTDYICKCVLAPAGETAQLDALAAGVYDMGAARIVQLD